jgi:hypothetical protein
MPGVSDVDCCQSVLVTWKGTGPKLREGITGALCCPISLNEVILTWCQLATPSTFHVSNILEWRPHLPCTGTEVLCGGPDMLTHLWMLWLAIAVNPVSCIINHFSTIKHNKVFCICYSLTFSFNFLNCCSDNVVFLKLQFHVTQSLCEE